MRKLAVIGHPISHSLSPVMQNAALAAAGLGGEWLYEAIDIAPEQLPQRLAELAGSGEYGGLNVTVPHKEAALAQATSASQAAREIGAANTLSFDGEGNIHADNTDAPGLLAAIGSPVEGSRALVLGAGGAARAVVWALAGAGAEVCIWARRNEAATALASEFSCRAWADGDAASAFDLIVNASAAGLGDGRALVHLPLEAGDLREVQIVVDMVYGERENDLTAAARAAGCRVVDGLEILVRQGALSFAIWTGQEPSLDVMRAALRDRA
jgi:shikimate dehydrogenase